MLLATVCLALGACARPEVNPTPTPDYPALETRVARVLGATLTAKAPTPTETARPTATPTTLPPSPTSTATATSMPTPTPAPRGAQLAFAHSNQDLVDNVVLLDLDSSQERILTHMLESSNMRDISWSSDGEWLVFVSAHDYIRSHRNERNVFVVRPDGTELRMITGEYMDPNAAPGPYATVGGRIEPVGASCLVCAQGATSPVLANENGEFELSGVPSSASWVRAICSRGDETLQGDVALERTGEGFEPVVIPVVAAGRGWSQAALSADERHLAGVTYRWELEGEAQRHRIEGVLVDLDTGEETPLDIPEDTTLGQLTWSRVGEGIVGSLTGEESTWLWQWGLDGTSIGPLVTITNTNQIIYSAIQPAWSPDGSQLALGLQHWFWWGENRYKTEIVLISPSVGVPIPIVTTEWGTHASHPTWSADGDTIYYQLTHGEPDADGWQATSGDIWRILLNDDTPGEPSPITSDGLSLLPAARPPVPKAD